MHLHSLEQKKEVWQSERLPCVLEMALAASMDGHGFPGLSYSSGTALGANQKNSAALAVSSSFQSLKPGDWNIQALDSYFQYKLTYFQSWTLKAWIDRQITREYREIWEVWQYIFKYETRFLFIYNLCIQHKFFQME